MPPVPTLLPADVQPRFSLVVPARNEERLLPALLTSVAAARERYAGGAAAVEVLVVDNASTDATAAVATAAGARVLREEKRVIAAVRNAGARQARGDILAFVDADTRIHPETFNVIHRALATHPLVAGATGVTLERWSAGLALSYACLLPLIWILRMDTGVVFCRKEDFLAVGGYDEGRLIAEDLGLLLALRRHGRASGRRLGRPRGAKAIASTRKFDRYGDWHYFREMPRVAMSVLLGRPTADAFIQSYWYGDQR